MSKVITCDDLLRLLTCDSSDPLGFHSQVSCEQFEPNCSWSFVRESSLVAVRSDVVEIG